MDLDRWMAETKEFVARVMVCPGERWTFRVIGHDKAGRPVPTIDLDVTPRESLPTGPLTEHDEAKAEQRYRAAVLANINRRVDDIRNRGFIEILDTRIWPDELILIGGIGGDEAKGINGDIPYRLLDEIAEHWPGI